MLAAANVDSHLLICYLSFMILILISNMLVVSSAIQRRFCSNLGMSNEEVKAVQETVQKAGNFDIRYYDILASLEVLPDEFSYYSFTCRLASSSYGSSV